MLHYHEIGNVPAITEELGDAIIFNFTEPHKPKALRLPPGQGLPFRDAMARVVDDLRSAIPAAFEAEEHQTRRNLIENELKERHEQAFQAIRHDAQHKSLALGQSPFALLG